jgi:hypothetical protein
MRLLDHAASPPAAKPRLLFAATEKQSFSANKWAEPEDITRKEFGD